MNSCTLPVYIIIISQVVKSQNILMLFTHNNSNWDLRVLYVCAANRFVNLGFDHYHTERPEQELVRMEVFTNRIGNTFTHINPCMNNVLLHIYSLTLNRCKYTDILVA